MMAEEIEILLAHRKYPSVSIIIPTDRLDPKRNHEVLKKSVRQGKALLAGKDLPGQITNELVSKLDMCSAHIPEIIPEGLGFYISPSLLSLISFPFEVKRKVTVGYSFERRDLLYLQQYKSPYYVLNLSRNGVHLFKGTLNELEEIKYEGFPMLYEDQFKYQPASVAGSSNASLAGNEKEKEKDQITDIRLRTVFRDADAHVRNLLSENTKVLLAGTQRLTSLFVGVTTLGVNLCGRVPGSYDENNIQKLRQNAWSLYYRIRKKDIERQIKAVIMNRLSGRSPKSVDCGSRRQRSDVISREGSSSSGLSQGRTKYHSAAATEETIYHDTRRSRRTYQDRSIEKREITFYR